MANSKLMDSEKIAKEIEACFRYEYSKHCNPDKPNIEQHKNNIPKEKGFFRNLWESFCKKMIGFFSSMVSEEGYDGMKAPQGPSNFEAENTIEKVFVRCFNMELEGIGCVVEDYKISLDDFIKNFGKNIGKNMVSQKEGNIIGTIKFYPPSVNTQVIRKLLDEVKKQIGLTEYLEAHEAKKPVIKKTQYQDLYKSRKSQGFLEY